MQLGYLIALLTLALGASAHAEGCRLSDSYVKKTALQYVREKLHRTNPATTDEKMQVNITTRNAGTWTVVVSPLPITPDASFVLRVSCGKRKVEEIDTP